MGDDDFEASIDELSKIIMSFDKQNLSKENPPKEGWLYAEHYQAGRLQADVIIKNTELFYNGSTVRKQYIRGVIEGLYEGLKKLKDK